MKLVILDRDGVINYDSAHYIKSPDEWLPLPGSLEAIGTLKKFGYKVAVATNQSGIARGLYDEKILAAIHEKMQQQLKVFNGKIDYIAFCPHHPKQGCACRKPETGLFDEIARYFEIDLTGKYYVGDSLTDIQAGKNSACKPVLVKTGNGMKTYERLENHKSILSFENLKAFVENLCDT